MAVLNGVLVNESIEGNFLHGVCANNELVFAFAFAFAVLVILVNGCSL